MAAIIAGALIAALALAGALTAMLFWQLKRSSSSVDKLLAEVRALSELKILYAANGVALADKERALNLLTAERDRLLFTIDTLEDQRDDLLQEALEHATPGSAAIAVRNALERLRAFPAKMPDSETLPNLPSE